MSTFYKTLSTALIKTFFIFSITKTVEQFGEMIWVEWEKIKDETIQNICKFFLNRMNKCIAVNGNQIKY